jgi:lipopolysaccharide/colanic/teichoic acid biosynthesis glycosyltransferase
MRILVLTQWYPPEPALLMQELAQTLQALGHDVTVLTGFPNYPSGTLYAGYRVRFFQREQLAGVPVVRVPLYPEHSRSGVRRALNYISFALSCALLAPWLLSRPDVIYVYHPPLTVGLPAVVLSRLWRVPFVYQVQDMWPETLAATGMLNTSRILGWIARFARWVYRRAAAICVPSPGFRRNLASKGVPESKVHEISNWIDPMTYHVADPDPDLAREIGLAARFNIMFAGNIGEAQGLETALAAAELLRQAKCVQFVLVGDGVALASLQEQARERGLANVRFLGRYPVDQMPRLYALADVLLIHLKDDPLFRITIPHKTFAYMASGKPILAAVAGDTAEIVDRAGAGLVCSPGDPRALAEAVRRFYEMPEVERQEMGHRGTAAARQEYSREALVGKIEQVLQGVVLRSGAPETAYARWGKRLLDLSLTIPALILLAPVLAMLAALVRVRLGAPVLFLQQRPGLNSLPFTICKFRTMNDARDERGDLLPDVLRLTRFGRFLRSTSLDELPELINVLRGEMSLVGPRPLLMRYLERYSDEQKRRHEVRPGITGWAQVNGRNAITWEQKFAYDVWYIDHCSLKLDVQILARTLVKIVRREGISQAGQATMEEFRGTWDRP